MDGPVGRLLEAIAHTDFVSLIHILCHLASSYHSFGAIVRTKIIIIKCTVIKRAYELGLSFVYFDDITPGVHIVKVLSGAPPRMLFQTMYAANA